MLSTANHIIESARHFAPARSVPGLPSVALSAQERRNVALRHPQLGSTRTTLAGPKPRFVAVAGQPSMKVQETPEGGVVTRIRRTSQYADLITDAEMRGIERLASQMLRDARGLSQGGLSLKRLAQMGHPYGRGNRTARGRRRRGLGRLQGGRIGVSNMAVVNRQSGDFANSWGVSIVRDKAGLTIELRNSAPHAKYLLGTSRMKAHGPNTTAPAKVLSQLSAEWLRVTRQAWMRDQSLRGDGGANAN